MEDFRFMIGDMVVFKAEVAYWRATFRHPVIMTMRDRVVLESQSSVMRFYNLTMYRDNEIGSVQSLKTRSCRSTNGPPR